MATVMWVLAEADDAVLGEAADDAVLAEEADDAAADALAELLDEPPLTEQPARARAAAAANGSSSSGVRRGGRGRRGRRPAKVRVLDIWFSFWRG
jgi:hypothetical protein